MILAPHRLHRLRRRLLRCYEAGMFALLLAVALMAVVPASSGEARAAGAQCGKTQSSAMVIVR